MITNTIANMGINIEIIANINEPPVSTVETIGFPNPAVVAEDVNLVPALALLNKVAVPPPAIIAIDQVTIGDKSATVDTITAVPAIAASGTAIVSNKLSINGM